MGDEPLFITKGNQEIEKMGDEAIEKLLKKFRKDVYSQQVSFKELFEMADGIYQEALREPKMDNKSCWKLIWFFNLLLYRLWFKKVEKKYPGSVSSTCGADPALEWQRSEIIQNTDLMVKEGAGLFSDPSEQPSQPEAE